jgi:hypothetical protein
MRAYEYERWREHLDTVGRIRLADALFARESERAGRFVGGIVKTAVLFAVAPAAAGAVTRGVVSAVRSYSAARTAAAVEAVVAASGGSVRQAIAAANEAGLTQSQVIQVITRVIEGSGRAVGGVVEVGSGARVMTSVAQGAGPIVYIAADGTATFGTANVAFSTGRVGELVTTVTNIILR